MPVSENGSYIKRLFVITKSLVKRIEKYKSEKVKNLNVSQIVRMALDKYLREKGY